MLIELLQNIIPVEIKQMLKPHFRLLFPNKIMSLLWITFRCTYKCSYCPYCGLCDYSKIFPKSCEKSGEEWIKSLETLPPTSFYISGGEPFLYKDLPYIINNMPKKHAILGIVTNASVPIEIYNKVNKKIHLNISYHNEFTNEDDFIKKVLLLKKKFNITVNIVATPDNLKFLDTFSKICKGNKITLHVDPLVEQGETKAQYTDKDFKLIKKYVKKDRNIARKNNLANCNNLKQCSAGVNYYNIMPNGDVSICSRMMEYLHSPLINNINDNAFKLGNIFNNSFKLNHKHFLCKYSCIDHCDMDYCSIKLIKN